jgi:hypothetical protein
MKKKLARKRFRIKNDEGHLIGDITAISMVSSPAIEKSFGLFAEESQKKVNFQISNKERMEITGPIMCADKDILRFDKDLEEYYYCFFTEEDVRDYRDVFMSQANTRQANFEHEDSFYDDFFLTESWIVEEPSKDKASALGFKDVKKGDWYGTFKCKNPNLWEELKNSELTGFSVEISLSEFDKLDIQMETTLNAILDNTKLTKEQKKEAIKAIIFK